MGNQASETPVVSIMTTTYNHEHYIEQTVRSVMEQETTFPLEMIVGEDCSTDNTRHVLLNLKKEFPERLMLYLPPENQGRRKNFITLFNQCRGRYIAIVEGDDFWTSPQKLQKQVDFLENNLDCAMVFHPVDQLWQNTGEQKPFRPKQERTKYSLEDLLIENFIGTCSILFRNNLYPSLPDWFWHVSAGDYPLHILNAQHGKIGYIPESMATYRIHGGGVWSSTSKATQLKNTIQYTEIIRDYLAPNHQAQLEKKLTLLHLRVITASWKQQDIPTIVKQIGQILSSGIPVRVFWKTLKDHR